jgi:hypothetical protein
VLIVLALLALAYLIKLSPPAAGKGSALTTGTDIQSLAFGAPPTERSLVIPAATSKSAYLERTATATVGTEEVDKRELPALGYQAASHDAAPAQLDHGKSRKKRC